MSQGQSLLFNFDDFLRITNDSDETIWGRYDGRDYEWQPGEYLDVHKVVATHIFGWLDPGYKYEPKVAQEIRERAMLRLGWIQPVHRPGEPEQTMKSAQKRLQKIKIGPLPPFQNVRLLRPKDAEGNDDPNRAPVIDVLPADTESAPLVAPVKQVGDGEATKMVLPEDPLKNVYQPPQRVEQAPRGKSAK